MTNINQLNWGILEIFYLIIIFAVGLIFTLLIIPIVIKYMKRKGNVGYDIHKNARPEIAESGGVSIVLGILLASIVAMLLFPVLFNIILIFILTITLAAIIGFIDDLKKLRSRYKILLTLCTGSVIFFANYYNFITISSPTLPFLGPTRIKLLYPLMVPVIVAVFANTVNMMEGYNGEGSGTCLIAVSFLFVCSLLWNSAEGLIFTIIAIAVLIPFFLYNKYPAKIFPGDIGTLSIGVMIACIAIFGSLEVAVFTALLMHIFNSFYILSSVKGFLESSKIQESKDDIILLEDDRIEASFQKGAVLTLPRLVLARGPLTEKELVNNFFAISIICGIFSIISTLLIVWTLGGLNIITLIIILLILVVPICIILYKFNRIRGVVFLMILLLIGGAIFLIFVDVYIMTLPFADIDLVLIQIPINILFTMILFVPGLILWYLISIKYFWIEIKKVRNSETIKAI